MTEPQRWTLVGTRYSQTPRVKVGGFDIPPCVSVEVMPVSEHDAEMARRSRVDHAVAEKLHAERDEARETVRRYSRELDEQSDELEKAEAELARLREQNDGLALAIQMGGKEQTRLRAIEQAAREALLPTEDYIGDLIFRRSGQGSRADYERAWEALRAALAAQDETTGADLQ